MRILGAIVRPLVDPLTHLRNHASLRRLAALIEDRRRERGGGGRVIADAIVIGAGPNGLVAANDLVDHGWDVVVLEAQPEPGGAVRSGELVEPGFVTDRFSAFYPLAAVSPHIARLDLERHGLVWSHAAGCARAPDARRAGRCAVARHRCHGRLARLLPSGRRRPVARSPARVGAHRRCRRRLGDVAVPARPRGGAVRSAAPGCAAPPSWCARLC